MQSPNSPMAHVKWCAEHMPDKPTFELDFEFDSSSWGELDFASEWEMKEGEEKAKEEIEQGVRVIEDVKAQRDKDMAKLEKMIIPLLINLAKNPDKEYIRWPNRKDKIESQIDAILAITRTYT